MRCFGEPEWIPRMSHASQNISHPERSKGSAYCHPERSEGSAYCHPERSEGSAYCRPERSEGSAYCHPERSSPPSRSGSDEGKDLLFSYCGFCVRRERYG